MSQTGPFGYPIHDLSECDPFVKLAQSKPEPPEEPTPEKYWRLRRATELARAIAWTTENAKDTTRTIRWAEELCRHLRAANQEEPGA